jgi:hypothetical protein
MAEPAGPMTFRCPLAVRSTCPPARCTAATISLASLERQRFGVACLFSAIPGDPQHPETLPRSSSWTAHPSARKPQRPGNGTVVQWVQPVGHTARSALGPCRNGLVRASAVTSGRQRFRETAGRRPSGSFSWDDARGRFGLWSRRSGVRVPSVTPPLTGQFALHLPSPTSSLTTLARDLQHRRSRSRRPGDADQGLPAQGMTGSAVRPFRSLVRHTAGSMRLVRWRFGSP